jgi:hypothetical protein
VNPVDNLDLAKFLASTPKAAPHEASIRGSCGRAYYAAFGVVAGAIASANIPLSGGPSAHRDVSSLLKRSRDPDIRTCGSLLEQLFNTRKSADYDVGSKAPRDGAFTPLKSQFAIGVAHAIITAVQKLQATDPRLAIP